MMSLVAFDISAPRRTLFVSGNRIEVPNDSSIAVSADWAATAVLTGNLFNQLGVMYKGKAPCAVILTGERQLNAITGNVVNASWQVTPRYETPSDETDWPFLNTVV